MKTYPKCEDCPLKDKQCIQEYTGHKPFCDWAKRGGAWRDEVIRLSNTNKEELFPVDEKSPELKPELPSLAEQGKNFIRSMSKFAKSGFKTADDELYKKRLDICNDCPILKDGRCLKCGCFVKAKAKILNEKCPINKW